jgi:hypothetical protein
MDFYVRIQDQARLAEAVAREAMGKMKTTKLARRDLVEALLDGYDRCKRPHGSSNFDLPDCGHYAWRRLASDLLDLMGSKRPIDMALLHQLSRHVDDAICAMHDGSDDDN